MKFNLSEKVCFDVDVLGEVYCVDDVKEFIRFLIKDLEEYRGVWRRGTIKMMIKERAGEKLSEVTGE